jgi:hypothetical protein
MKHKNFTLVSRFLILIVLALPGVAPAQISGGQHTFRFFELPTSARLTALGGAQIAVRDEDLALASQNPAALNPLMDGRLTLQHNFFLADIQHSYAGYAAHLPRWGFTVHGAVQHVGYGTNIRADEYGEKQGEFNVSETALTLGAARPLTDRVSLGLNLRYGFSSLDTYRASALAADAGLLYVDTASLFTAAVVLRNAGTQVSTYAGDREDLPFDLQVAVSKRLRHLPFRLTILAHHLHQWDLRYNDPNLRDDDVLIFGGEEETSSQGNPGVDNFFRHFIFNGEFLLGRNELLRLRLGYNHLRKRELSVGGYRSLAGFSAGLGVKINRFRIDFGYGSYHLGGGVVHFGLGTNLKDFF